MHWLKRNLALFVVLAVGVVLIGLGGYYVWNQYALNEELNGKLGGAKRELTRLTTEVKPTPNEENVRLAREDLRKAREFSTLSSRLFVPTPFQTLTSQGYRSMLETNLANLRRMATLSRVALPTNYTFSFQPQTKPMSFELSSLKPLSDQLVEIGEICHALFNARIHELLQIRRVAVSQYDSGFTDILSSTVVSNRFTGLAIWPYEFTFECFSEQLAAALGELSRLPRMVVVKTITVEGEPPAANVPPPTGPGAPAQPVPTVPGRGPGRRLPGNATATTAAAATAPKPGTLTTVLEERPLRVVVLLHVIKPVR